MLVGEPDLWGPPRRDLYIPATLTNVVFEVSFHPCRLARDALSRSQQIYSNRVYGFWDILSWSHRRFSISGSKQIGILLWMLCEAEIYDVM